eukprot:GHVQ01012628.1.p1 GENE.GHVQ01012628.1~~GHVQ01012628.1.p1  ORF type:complete len:358 (-),score=71.38 GHVQ01012628.1:455-1528(-)
MCRMRCLTVAVQDVCVLDLPTIAQRFSNITGSVGWHRMEAEVLCAAAHSLNLSVPAAVEAMACKCLGLSETDSRSVTPDIALDLIRCGTDGWVVGVVCGCGTWGGKGGLCVEGVADALMTGVRRHSQEEGADRVDKDGPEPEEGTAGVLDKSVDEAVVAVREAVDKMTRGHEEEEGTMDVAKHIGGIITVPATITETHITEIEASIRRSDGFIRVLVVEGTATDGQDHSSLSRHLNKEFPNLRVVMDIKQIKQTEGQAKTWSSCIGGVLDGLSGTVGETLLDMQYVMSASDACMIRPQPTMLSLSEQLALPLMWTVCKKSRHPRTVVGIVDLSSIAADTEARQRLLKEFDKLLLPFN